MSPKGGEKLRDYETTIVLDSSLEEEAIDREIRRVEEVIASGGGEVSKLERWGVKRFAYLLRKHRQGFYLHLRFSGPTALPRQLESFLKVNEQVLRYLTVVSQPAKEVTSAPERSSRRRARESAAPQQEGGATPNSESRTEPRAKASRDHSSDIP